jgi:ribonuclease HIII
VVIVKNKIITIANNNYNGIAWGKMNAGQMLAHCNITYEMAYENIHPIRMKKKYNGNYQ